MTVPLSVAITDAVLAAASLGSAGWLLRVRDRAGALELAALGLGLVGVAAGAGALRFAGMDAVIPLHEALAAVARAVALPLVGVAYALTVFVQRAQLRRTLRLVALIAVPLAAMLFGRIEGYPTAISALALVVVVGACARRPGGAAGIAGAVLVAAAGLGVGSEGAWGPVLRVDVFHLLLAAGHVGLAMGIARVAPALAVEKPLGKRRRARR